MTFDNRFYIHFARFTCCRYYYSIALLVLQYVIPITVLVFTYTSIAIMVWGKRPPGEAENIRDQRMARSKRKVRFYMRNEFIFFIFSIGIFISFFIIWNYSECLFIYLNGRNEKLNEYELYWIAILKYK